MCSQEEEAEDYAPVKALAPFPIAFELGESPCNPRAHRLASKPKAKRQPGAPGAVRITKSKYVRMGVHVQVTGNGKTKPRKQTSSWPQRLKRLHLGSSTYKAI